MSDLDGRVRRDGVEPCLCQRDVGIHLQNLRYVVIFLIFVVLSLRRGAARGPLSVLNPLMVYMRCSKVRCGIHRTYVSTTRSQSKGKPMTARTTLFFPSEKRACLGVAIWSLLAHCSRWDLDIACYIAGQLSWWGFKSLTQLTSCLLLSLTCLSMRSSLRASISSFSLCLSLSSSSLSNSLSLLRRAN